MSAVNPLTPEQILLLRSSSTKLKVLGSILIIGGAVGLFFGIPACLHEYKVPFSHSFTWLEDLAKNVKVRPLALPICGGLLPIVLGSFSIHIGRKRSQLTID